MSKRLNSRIRDLETATSEGTDLTAGDKRMLVGILAKRDALHWPWRYQFGSQIPFAEIHRRQAEYLAGQAGILSKAESQNWKAVSERRQRLIASGLMTGVVSGGQVVSVLLTARGEAIARALVGLRLGSFWTEGLEVASRLFALAGSKAGVAVRESVLWDQPCVGSPSSWDCHTESIMPAITAGVVHCHSDSQGRACFSIVKDEKIPENVVVDVPCEDWADDLYVKTFDRERRTLESAEPRDSSELYIPLPASGWGQHYQGANTDVE